MFLLELLLLWTDQSRVLTFGIAGVLGMLAGAAAMALATRTFRWEGFASIEDVANHIVGAVLMGFGGVTALGCTIGQGLSGISTLAVGSILALAAIIGGCVAGLKYQMWRIERGEMSAMRTMEATGGTEGVGRAATRGVVVSIFLVLIANVFLVKLIEMVS